MLRRATRVVALRARGRDAGHLRRGASMVEQKRERRQLPRGNARQDDIRASKKISPEVLEGRLLELRVARARLFSEHQRASRRR